MTLKIFQRQYDFKNNWLQHKLMMPIFIALLSKLYIWAFTQFKEHENFENKLKLVSLALSIIYIK